MQVGILKYGAGNIYSVENMLIYLGCIPKIVEKPSEIFSCDKLILPGVGNFDFVIENLKKNNLFHQVIDYASAGNPLLGICAGMQILFGSSEEGKQLGLGLLPGKISFLGNLNANLPVPNMGWSFVNHTNCELLEGTLEPQRFYFAHSFARVSNGDPIEKAHIEYGSKIVCIANKNNIWGVQFHPEKSHKFGLNIFKNFLRI